MSTVFGTALAETIAADPAFPPWSAAPSPPPTRNAGRRWTCSPSPPNTSPTPTAARPAIRHDEYARLMTYSIDLFTTAAPYERDLNAEPVAAEPPMTPEEEEALHHLHPDPGATAGDYPPAATLIDFDRDDDALLAALGVDLDQGTTAGRRGAALDFDALYAPFEPGTGFEDQYPRAVLPEVGLRRTRRCPRAARPLHRPGRRRGGVSRTGRELPRARCRGRHARHS